jgi:unsaturated rhamnogalacturonyl hydrolase
VSHLIVDTSLTLIDRVSAATMRYPFKVWGFGESIAVQGLLAAGADAQTYAVDMLRHWAESAGPLADEPLAHVAPGVPLLELYRLTAEGRLLDRALELASVLAATVTGRHGARLHRPDLPGWEHEVWVDCMHLDGPFLVHLAQVTGDQHWADLAASLLLAHARVLQDERCGLFSHGFDDASGQPNGVFWGRGQGWALLGLGDTLGALPGNHPARAEIAQRGHALADGLRHTEANRPGCWHTVVDAPQTYLEPSVGAFVALGIAGVAGDMALARRALEATERGINAAGELTDVSDATPVGSSADQYVQRGHGVFPWGQGPALLALERAARGESA